MASAAHADADDVEGPEREAVIAALHTLLLNASRVEVNRRRAAFPHLRSNDHDDLADQSTDDALLTVLSKFADFRGDSRLITWAERLLARLIGPPGPELTCEECFEQLDRYVERELRLTHVQADQGVPGMRPHLDGCPACDEDHQSLLALVAQPRVIDG